MALPVELYDWIVTKNRVRGSVKGDNGFWLCGANNDGNMFKYNPDSEKPLWFDSIKRILKIANGNQYILHKNTVCKALNLHITSEKILQSLIKQM